MYEDPFLDHPPVSFDFWEVRDDVEPMFRSSQHYPPPRTPQYQSPHSSSSHFPPRTSDHYLRESGRRGEQLPPVKQCFLIPFKKPRGPVSSGKQLEPTIGSKYRLFLEDYVPSLYEQAQLGLCKQGPILHINDPHGAKPAKAADRALDAFFPGGRHPNGSYYPYLIQLSGPGITGRIAGNYWHCIVQIGGRRWSSPDYNLRDQG